MAGRLAHGAPPSAPVLRTTGLLEPDLADQVTDWYTGTATAPRASVRAAYVVTGEKPALRADLPPAELVAACDAAVALR